MKKWVPITLLALTTLATGCMSRQLTSDIDQYAESADAAARLKTFQRQLPPKITSGLSGNVALDEYIAAALEHNPAVAAAKGRWLAANARAVSEAYPKARP